MLTLYSKESCPFCHRVLQMAENLGVDLNVKDIEDDEETQAELMEKGGKSMVPFLVDEEKSVSMYESSDIIDYIRDNYVNTTTTENKPRIHTAADATCIACEG